MKGPADYAAKIINQTNRHVFLTGKAGTGKTTFLRNIILKTHKKTIVVAPTGIAAINAGGVTIHSQFQLPFGPFVPSKQFNVNSVLAFKVNNPDSIFKNFQMSGAKRQVLRSIELLIIDEVSMLRADLLDAINTVLKSVRRNQQAFGGVQVLFIGDLLQLPPVVKDDEWQLLGNYYKSIYFFDAQVLKEDKPIYIELDKIYRQSDKTFINLLNNFRNNEVEQDDMELLNRHYKPNFRPSNDENYITLSTHNAKADAINKAALDDLHVKSHYFQAIITGEFNEYAYPVEKYMELKVGAQVMFIKNDTSSEKRFFNGKLAKIESIDDDGIKVKFDSGPELLKVEHHIWKNIKYELNEGTNEIEEKEMGSFSQFPIKLAWAITIHKSQGLTFEKAILDINAAFAPGQVYVALSRLKSLDGLVLTAPALRLNTSQDETIRDFGNSKKHQGDLDGLISEETINYSKNYLIKAFNFYGLHLEVGEHLVGYNKIDSQSEKQKYLPWARQLQQDFETLWPYAEKFTRQINEILSAKNENYFQTLFQRVEAAVNYFDPKLKEFSSRIRTQQDALQDEKKVKGYLKELSELEAAFYRQLEAIHRGLILVKSIVSNSEFDKNAVNEGFNKDQRQIEIEEFNKKIDAKTSKSKEYEGNKPSTKQISFDLHQAGNSIAEIAKIRNLTITTIESHLAHYVATGEIDILQLLSAEKLQTILTTAEKLEQPLFNALKEVLGDEYSYSDLRFAYNHKKYVDSKSEKEHAK